MAQIEVKLAQFEGPLDLLLHLIEKAEMDIQDVRISEITAQYLALMPQTGALDMDAASEFLAMAANLLYIKSRALLPRAAPPVAPGEEDPEQALIRQIRDYKIYKEAAAVLRQRNEQAAKVYARMPDEYPLPPPVFQFTGASPDALLQALARLLLREQATETESPTRQLVRDVYTIGDRIEAIRKHLARGNGRPLPFESLFPVGGGRDGIVVTFTALLEMASAQQLRIVQHGAFAPIEVVALPALAQTQ